MLCVKTNPIIMQSTWGMSVYCALSVTALWNLFALTAAVPHRATEHPLPIVSHITVSFYSILLQKINPTVKSQERLERIKDKSVSQERKQRLSEIHEVLPL